jgi:4-hydroxybenzoate polyprenyltransferase
MNGLKINNEKVRIIAIAMRINQWSKNLIVFTAILFAGQLFNPELFFKSLYAFAVFSLLSSASYLLNDVIDYPYDRKHPIKKNRPIASGKLEISEATFLVFILIMISLVASLFFSGTFFFLSFLFLLLHFLYSLYLKKYPVIDIFTISFSFMLRAFAGEVVTGYHIPIWLLLTIFFVSLFMAAVKRHAELVTHGTSARSSMAFYKGHLLDFMTNTFATLTIIAYASYTYFEQPPHIETIFTSFFSGIFPSFEARKWMMLTIPFVVYGIARYAQLLYERDEGERPEKIIVSDTPLLTTLLIWGIVIILFIYVL